MDKITVEFTHVSEELWELTAGSSNDSEIGEPASLDELNWRSSFRNLFGSKDRWSKYAKAVKKNGDVNQLGRLSC